MGNGNHTSEFSLVGSYRIEIRQERLIEQLRDGRAPGEFLRHMLNQGLEVEKAKRATNPPTKVEPVRRLVEDKGAIFTCNREGVCWKCGRSYAKSERIGVRSGRYYHLKCFDELSPYEDE